MKCKYCGKAYKLDLFGNKVPCECLEIDWHEYDCGCGNVHSEGFVCEMRNRT